MKRSLLAGATVALLAAGLIGCSAPATPERVEVTRVAEVTRQTEVTRIVEVTRLAEVTRQVEATRVVPQTVIVTATSAPTDTPAATPTPRPTPSAPQAKRFAPEQVITAFKAAGLDAESSGPMTKEDYGMAPYVGQGMRFLIPSLCADCGGRVLAIDDKADLQRAKAFYDNLGKQSAMLFSWTYVRENILVQLNGDLPEAQAKKYEAALLAMK